ncbi:TetR/AcrR family transcriptional regulator [Clavibacter michiganensis]|uniref:TetR/AcrR family transcriptional regulator n=1 Tax=Clavibacter michiganensis TaxID=28447 RepID=A0A2S5VT72_9MICO|nr:TetR/AcrR family transcriptional regulator [Clavibacter michiganensis]PPF67364.1 TetR/AcrR family transcriptional regulator [Clavibacter michiganensis]
MITPVPDLAPLTPGGRRVLDAASELFYARGIHVVGVDAIAAAAGVTKKTIYDRFGSKEQLVVAYLQHRDARWREHLAVRLARTPDPGADRVLAVFDAAITWADANTPKGCSAINARAELGAGDLGDEDDGHEVLPETMRQKAWLLELIRDLCREAGAPDPAGTARTLMLLYEGALVTLGMGTFGRPFEAARDAARAVLAAALATSAPR